MDNTITDNNNNIATPLSIPKAPINRNHCNNMFGTEAKDMAGIELLMEY
jgi:hypothetical protein